MTITLTLALIIEHDYIPRLCGAPPVHHPTESSEQTDGDYCRFTDGETEAQRDKVTWLRSPASGWW